MLQTSISMTQEDWEFLQRHREIKVSHLVRTALKELRDVESGAIMATNAELRRRLEVFMERSEKMAKFLEEKELLTAFSEKFE